MFFHPQFLRAYPGFDDQIIQTIAGYLRERLGRTDLGEEPDMFIALENLAIDFIQLQIVFRAHQVALVEVLAMIVVSQFHGDLSLQPGFAS